MNSDPPRIVRPGCYLLLVFFLAVMINWQHVWDSLFLMGWEPPKADGLTVHQKGGAIDTAYEWWFSGRIRRPGDWGEDVDLPLTCEVVCDLKVTNRTDWNIDIQKFTVHLSEQEGESKPVQAKPVGLGPRIPKPIRLKPGETYRGQISRWFEIRVVPREVEFYLDINHTERDAATDVKASKIKP